MIHKPRDADFSEDRRIKAASEVLATAGTIVDGATRGTGKLLLKLWLGLMLLGAVMFLGGAFFSPRQPWIAEHFAE